MVEARRSLVVWLVLAACTAAAAAPTAQWRPVAKGETSEFLHSNEFLVIHTTDDFARALGRRADDVGSKASGDVLASVDFGTETVIGIMLSNRPAGCSGVDITSIAYDGIVAVIHYRERKRRREDVCSAALSSPFEFVAVPKTSAPFRFTEDGEP